MNELAGGQRTNLARVCEALKWQGGTIHQVNEEVLKLIGIPVDVLNLKPYYVDELIKQIERATNEPKSFKRKT